MGANLGPLGGPGLVAVEPGVESACRPGSTSVVSEPLDEHTDFVELWMGVIKWMKKGRDKPHMSKLEVELQKLFILAQLAPRSTYPATPHNIPTHELSPAGQDMVAFHFVHFPERQMKEIRCEVMCSGHCVARQYFLFHDAPLCLEAWAESAGQRYAGELLRQIVSTTLARILARAHPGEIEAPKTFCNIEDPPNSGLMTVLTEPLDRYISFERLWTEWLDLLKYPNTKGGPVKNIRLDVHTERDFTLLQVADGAKAESLWLGENRPGQEVRDLKKVHANIEVRSIYVEHFLEKEDTPRRYWIKFTGGQELRIQAWAESAGRRHSGEIFAKYVENMLDAVLTANKSDAQPSASG